MEIRLAVSKIYDNCDYNPACFNFSEAVAREKKLWRDSRPMPTAEELAAVEVAITQEQNLKSARDSKKLTGKLVREVCQNILDIIAGHNVANQVSSEDIDAMAAAHGNILSLLQANRPFQAKGLIIAMSVGGVITQELKNEILSEYEVFN